MPHHWPAHERNAISEDTAAFPGADPGLPCEVVRNGAFGSAGEECSGSEFYAGEEFSGWVMIESLMRRAAVMRLWAEDHPRSLCVHGHSAVLSGTIAQVLVTEPFQRYRLSYSAHSIQPSDPARSSVGDLLIDDVVVQTFVTPSRADAVAHEAYFTATSSETLLSFSLVGRFPFALRNVSAEKVAVPSFSESDMIGSVLCG